jgi:hypothetical protein
MSDSNKLPVKRDWMDWVQTGASVYGAYKVGQIADHIQSEQEARQMQEFAEAVKPLPVSVPETLDIPEWRKKAVLEASLETNPLSDNTRVFGERMAFFARRTLFRIKDACNLRDHAGRPLFNLYDSLSMFRDTVESAYKRAADPWMDSNERYFLEIANHAQLDWMRRSLPEGQQDDFWEWQTFMLSRQYARELLNKAAWDNERPAPRVTPLLKVRHASVTVGKVVVSLLGSLGLFAFGAANSEKAGLSLLIAVCAFPFVLLVLMLLDTAVSTVASIDTRPAPPPPRRNRRQPSLTGIKQKIAWLVKVGWLPEGSPTFGFDAETLRERMQKAAVLWRRRPIINAYIKARRHYYWELSFTGRRRKLDAELQRILTSPVDDECREKGFFHKNSDIKYMPPGPERDALAKHAIEATERERQDAEAADSDLKRRLKARGWQP